MVADDEAAVRKLARSSGQPYDGLDFEGLVRRSRPLYDIDAFLRQWAGHLDGRPLVLAVEP